MENPVMPATVADMDKVAPPPDTAFMDLRQLYGKVDQDLLYLSFRAIHLLDWSQKTRFCKKCGLELTVQETERAKKCPGFGQQSFPASPRQSSF